MLKRANRTSHSTLLSGRLTVIVPSGARSIKHNRAPTLSERNYVNNMQLAKKTTLNNCKSDMEDPTDDMSHLVPLMALDVL